MMSFLQHMLFLLVIILMINSICSSTIDIESTTQSIYEKAIAEIRKMKDDLKKMEEQLKIDREKLQEEKEQIQKSIENIDIFQLNIGGEIILTTRETLTKIPKSTLSLMFNGRWEHKLQRDQDGNIFFDFNPIIFRHLLDQLQIMDTTNSIQFYPPFQRSLIQPFNKMIKKLGLQQVSSSNKKNIITFNVGGQIITTRHTTLTQVSNSTFDTIVSSSKIRNFNNESDIFVDYDPKLFQHLINQLREESFSNISHLGLSSYEERIAFEKMLVDLNIYRASTAISITTTTKAVTTITAALTVYGPQLNFNLSSLTGAWSLCYSALYSVHMYPNINSILSRCYKSKLLLGCRPVGNTLLTLAAMGDRADVLYNCSTNSTMTHQANGVGWYFSIDAGNWNSWGFVYGSDSVRRHNCDGDTTTNSGYRLCWHMIGTHGGYRCGSSLNLDTSTSWERVIYHAM